MSPAPLRSDPAVRLQATLPSLPSTDAAGNRKYATSWLAQFWVLLGRTAKLKFRDPLSFATILSGVIVVSLLEGSIYYDMPVGDWQNRIGGISMAKVGMILPSPSGRTDQRDSTSAQRLIPRERIYCRKRSGRI